MSDTTLTILGQVISILKANVSLTALVSDRIYSYIPQTVIYPFIRVSISSKEENSLSKSEPIHTVRIQSFVQGETIKPALDIRTAVFNVLDRNSSFQQCEWNNSDCFLEDDRKTWQALIEFKIN